MRACTIGRPISSAHRGTRGHRYATVELCFVQRYKYAILNRVRLLSTYTSRMYEVILPVGVVSDR
jgi:hypothetical protein